MSTAFLKKRKDRIPVFLLAVVIVISYWHIGDIGQSVKSALLICTNALIPSLFPFLILAEILNNTIAGRRLTATLSVPFQHLLKLSPSGASCYLISVLLGFPLGFRSISLAYQNGKIPKKEAEKLLLIGNNASPAFLIGGIGIGLLQNVKAGIFLLLSQWLVSLLFGFFLFRTSKRTTTVSAVQEEHSTCNFANMITHASLSMLYICGFVIFFSAVGRLLLVLIPASPFSYLLISFLEIGTATAYIAQHLSYLWALPLCGFAVCFSGISCYMQGINAIKDTDLQTKFYIPCKLLQGALSLALLAFLQFFMTR